MPQVDSTLLEFIRAINKVFTKIATIQAFQFLFTKLAYVLSSKDVTVVFSNRYPASFAIETTA